MEKLIKDMNYEELAKYAKNYPTSFMEKLSKEMSDAEAIQFLMNHPVISEFIYMFRMGTLGAFYGGLGQPTEPIFFTPIAASVSPRTNSLVRKAESFIKENYPEVKIMYSDADSIYVDL